MSERWSTHQAWEWYRQQPWMVGCNYIPGSAINQLEMWQADTFDTTLIERELTWAQSLGFNTLRVYLHDLLWQQDAAGFTRRIYTFLDLCASRGIKPIFVFFDDCWNQEFALGPQPAPKPGVHNSGWVQSPGVRTVLDPASWPRLQTYLQGVLEEFRADPRIRLWDLYNEPGNSQMNERSLGLLKAAFAWARDVNPSQPLTAGVWFDNAALNEFQLAASDVITFHDYNPVDQLQAQINRLRRYERPLICTEYMSRGRGSRFETHLPVFRAENVGCINWGLVNGKTQTHLPWSTEIDPNLNLWFHDIFYPDGTPYREDEVAFIRRVTLG